jgi:PAS domain S-box-containing protein
VGPVGEVGADGVPIGAGGPCPPPPGEAATLRRLLSAAGALFTADPTTLTLASLDVEAARAAHLLPASGPDDWRSAGFAAGLVDPSDRARVEAARLGAGDAPRTVEWRSTGDRCIREVLVREAGLLVGAWIDLGPAPPLRAPPDLCWLDEVPDPVFVKDDRHRWILVNRAFCDLMGHPREALLGKSDRDFFPPEQAEVFRAKDALVLADGRVNVNEEWLTDRKGRTLRISTKKSAFDDHASGRKILVGVIRDITDRVAAEVALRESEARFRAIFDQGPLGMALLDGGLRLGQVNPALCRMLGREPAELLGRSLAELTHHEDRGREGDTAEHLLRGDVAVQKSERRYLRPDGTVVWAALTVSLIGETDDGQNPCFMAMLEDADERKGAESAVLEARDAALESARAKSRFLAVMSHEIRTPMNAVVGMTGVLLDTRLTPEQRECVETIRHSGDALLELIDDILDFSKLESDRLELERISFGLRSCVESAMDLVAARAAEKGLALSLVVDDPAPVQVVGDPSRIRQVLLNLLSNAVKFTAEGEVRVIVKARPLAAPRWELCFAVADSGVGIPPDRLGRLFQAFSQVDATTTRRYGGTGLGLAICKRLVELMEGSIGVESLPGSGSTFRVVLPLDAVPDARDELIAGRAALAGRRLLVVEEGLGARLMAGRLAEAWGMAAKVTGDPREALAWIDAGEAFHAGLIGERAGAAPHAPLPIGSTGLDAYALARAMRERRDARALPLVLAIDVGQSGMQRLGGLFQGQVTRPVKASQLQSVLLGVLGERPATTSDQEAAPPAIDHALGARHPLRILLVDDNAVNLRVATRVLERMGYRADTATTGAEALDAVRRLRFDVVLMDVQMPVMDGVEATRRIRAELPADLQPRIVAMTADVLPGDRERCLASGMDDFVGKPVRVEEVQAALLRAPAGSPAPGPEGEAPRPARPEPRRVTTRGTSISLPLDPHVVDLTATVWSRTAPAPSGSSGALDEECLRSLRAAAGESAIHDLLELFLTDVPPMLDAIRASVASGDAPEVLRVAHGLRGSCGALGARLMIAPCAALEAAARAQDLSEVGQHLRALLDAFERTRADAAIRIREEDRRGSG